MPIVVFVWFGLPHVEIGYCSRCPSPAPLPHKRSSLCHNYWVLLRCHLEGVEGTREDAMHRLPAWSNKNGNEKRKLGEEKGVCELQQGLVPCAQGCVQI
jgi:hypothetical protein